MESNTPQGFRIQCDCVGCRRYILSREDPFLMRKYARKHAESSGYVRKEQYWLCAEHKNMTVGDIERQFEKNNEEEEYEDGE